MNIQKIQTDLDTIRDNIPLMFGHQCADEAVKLASILSYLNVQAAGLRQTAYKEILHIEVAAKAEIALKASDSYRSYKEVEGLAYGIKEMINALKAKVRVLEDEKTTV